MQRPGSEITTGPELAVIGLVRERRRLCEALRNGESLLVTGGAGSGKTRAIHEALKVEGPPSLHRLLVSISRALINASHRSFLNGSRPGNSSEFWLQAQTSVHLRGLLWNAFEQEPVRLVLDGIRGAGFPAYRFLRRVYHMPGMAMVAAARDVRALGALSRLFWDPRQSLQMAPLSEAECDALFDAAADAIGLRHLELDAFRNKVLQSAKGNPGQIIEMCRLATQPRYVSGRYIKFAPLRIDTVMKFPP